MKTVENINNNIEDNLDLKDDLIQELYKRGFVKNYEAESILNYFLNEDLMSTFGKTKFDISSDIEKTPSEIEMTRTKDGMFISTIFGKHYRVNFRDNGMDVYEISSESGNINEIENIEKVFDITIGQNNIINNLVKTDGEEKYEQNYEVNTENETFHYCSGSVDKERDYSACIMGLGAKFGARETVHYVREIPPVIKGRNPFKRLMQAIEGRKLESGECITSVVTSDSLTNLVYYCDHIFNILKKEAEKAIQKSNDGKNLQMKNEKN